MTTHAIPEKYFIPWLFTNNGEHIHPLEVGRLKKYGELKKVFVYRIEGGELVRCAKTNNVDAIKLFSSFSPDNYKIVVQ